MMWLIDGASNTYLDPYDFSSIPCRVSCNELIRILHLSSLAIFDCLMREMAVTRVSIALAKSPEKNKVIAGEYMYTGAIDHGF